MRHIFRPLDGLLRERRLLRDQPDGAKEQDLKKMENLHMAEFREKSKNAYDKVNDRVQEYRTETQKLRNQLSAVRNSNSQWQNLQQRRLRNVEENTARITREIGKTYKTYSDDVLKQMSAGNKNIAKMAQLQDRLFYRVDVLENFYTHVETIIGNVEKDLLAKNVNVQPTLKERMLARRMETFDRQRNSTNEQDQLRTIEIDWYSQPFNKMENRAYHLLRLPGNADVSFEGSPLPQKGRDYDEINLSGGAKYVKFTAEFMQRIPAEEPLPFRMRLAFPDPNGGPDQVHIATPHKTTDGLNNLTFSFEQRAQAERKPRRPIFEQRPQQPPAEQKPPAEKKELPPQEKKELPPQDKKELPPQEKKEPPQQDKQEPPLRLWKRESPPPAAPVSSFSDKQESMPLDAIEKYMLENYLPALNSYIEKNPDVAKDPKSFDAFMNNLGFKPDGNGAFIRTEKDRFVTVHVVNGKVVLKGHPEYTRESNMEYHRNALGKYVQFIQNSKGDKNVIASFSGELSKFLALNPSLEELTDALRNGGLNVSMDASANGVIRGECKTIDGKTFVLEIQNGKILSCGLATEKKEAPKDIVAQMKEIFDALRQGSDKINGAVVRGALDTLAAAFPDSQALLKVLTDLGVAAKLEGQKVVASFNIGNNVLVFSIENGKVIDADLQVQEGNKTGPTSYAAIIPLIALAGLPLAKITYNKVKTMAGARQINVAPTSTPPPKAEAPRGQHMVMRQELFEIADNLKPYLRQGADADNIAQALADYMDINNNLLLEPAEKLKALKPIEAEIKAQLRNPEQFKELTQYYQDYVTRSPGDPEVKAPPVKDAPAESGKKTVSDANKKTVAEKKPVVSEKWAQMESKIKAQLRTPADPKALEEVKGLLTRLSIRVDPRKIPEGWQALRDQDMAKLKALLADGANADELLADYVQTFRVRNPNIPFAQPVEPPKPQTPAAPEKVKVVPNLTEDVRARIRSTGDPYKILGINPADIPGEKEIRIIQNKLLGSLLKDPANLKKAKELIAELYQMEVAFKKDAVKLRGLPEWKALKQQIKALLTDAKDIDIAEKIVKARHMVINRNPATWFDFDEDIARISPEVWEADGERYRAEAEAKAKAAQEKKAPAEKKPAQAEAKKPPEAKKVVPESKWPNKDALFKNYLHNPDSAADLNRVRDCFQHIENAFADAKRLGPDNLKAIVAQNLEEIRAVLKDPKALTAMCEEYGTFVKSAPWKNAGKTVWPLNEGVATSPVQQKPGQIGLDKKPQTPAAPEKVKAGPNLTEDVRARIRGSKNPYEILGLDAKKLPSIEDLGKLQNKLMKDIVKDPNDLSKINKLIGEMYQIEVDAGKDAAKLKEIPRWKELKQQIKALLTDAKDIDIAEKLVKARHMVINKNPGLVFDALDVDQLLKPPTTPAKAPTEAAPKNTTKDVTKDVTKGSEAAEKGSKGATETVKGSEAAEKTTKEVAEVGKEAANLAKAEAMKKFLELTKGLDQEKALALLTEHGASLGMDAKTIANFQKSSKAGGAFYEAVKGGDAASMQRLLEAGKGASKMRIALNALGVGMDVFALAMTYNDWQANGGRIEAANATGNKALANLYKDAYTMYTVEGATTLVCGTVALVSSTAGLCLLPVTMVVMGAGHVYREVEGMRENMLKSYKDYLGLPPAEMLHKMHELLNTYSYTGKAFLWMGKGASWEDAKQTEFSHAANALTQLTRSYLMKTAEVSPAPGENQEDFQKRFELYVRDAMDYLGRQTGSRYTQASSWELPAMFRRAMAHAQLCATSRELSGAGMTREVTWKGDDGKEYKFDLSKYHEAPPDGLNRDQLRKWHEEKEKAVRAYMGERDAEKFESVKNVVGLMNEKNKNAEGDPNMSRHMFMQQMLLQEISHDLHKYDQVLQFSDFSGLDIPLISEGDTNARTLVRYATFLQLRKELRDQATSLLGKPDMSKKDFDQAVQNLRNILAPSERGALARQQFSEKQKLNETSDYARAKAFANRLLQPDYIAQNLALPSTNITQTGTKEKPAEMHSVFESPDRTIVAGPDGVAHLKGMKGYHLIPIHKNGMAYANEGTQGGSDDFAFHGEGYFAVWKPENAPIYNNAFTTPDLVIRVVKPETAAERGKTINNPIDINHRNPPRNLTRPYNSPLYLRMPGPDYQWGRFGPNGQIEETLVTNQSPETRGTLSIQAPGEYGFWPKDHPEQHFQIHIN